jgi:hypothetical protein
MIELAQIHRYGGWQNRQGYMVVGTAFLLSASSPNPLSYDFQMRQTL